MVHHMAFRVSRLSVLVRRFELRDWPLISIRLCGLALLCSVPALLLAGQHTPENDKNPLAGNAAAIRAGKRLYEQTCQSCHGGEGRGDRAPGLATGTFRRGAKDGEIFQNIRNGIAGTAMPPFPRLTSDQAWQLVSYIRSLSAVAVPTNERAPGNAAGGEQIFYGKGSCSSCHEVNARGGIVGPDLSAAGSNSAEKLRQKILDPNAIAEGGQRAPSTFMVKTRDGQEIRGIRLNEDSFSLQMRDASGKLFLLDRENLVEERSIPVSLMPSDYGKRLSESEIANLVAFLKGLGGRDFSKTIAAEISGGLTYERLRRAEAEPQNWLTYWGDYQGRHFSALKQINSGNVRQLQARWAMQMPGDSLLETTPLVIDGIMYTAGMPGQVFAIDARTGLQIWRYQRQQKAVNAYESNRLIAESLSWVIAFSSALLMQPSSRWTLGRACLYGRPR